ncbi:MAG: MerR family transcriptional regulator [Maricaulaceae bacterium]
MQSKTTRAFRTISEAASELELQPHVLRFWESKFSQIRPIKRAGGRRLYRAEDIDLLRGIKILLHEEKHPIKDVQKIIRLKGPNKVIELGRTVQQAATPKDVVDTVLIPERIATSNTIERAKPISIHPVANVDENVGPTAAIELSSKQQNVPEIQPSHIDIAKLKATLLRLKTLRVSWGNIDNNTSV